MLTPSYLPTAGIPGAPSAPSLPIPAGIEADVQSTAPEQDFTTADAQDILPKALKDAAKLKAFEGLLEEMCMASKRQIEPMLPIWAQLDDGQKNKSPQGLKPPYKGAPEYHFPVLEPNLDKGRAFIAQPLSKANPHILVHAGGPTGDRTGRVETALHTVLSRAGYSRWLRQAIDVAQRRGKSTIRALFESAEKLPNGRENPPGLRIDVYSPEHRVRYPNWAVRWQDVLCDGTRWECTVEEIKHLQEEGYYLKPDVEIVEGKEEDALPEKFDQERQDDAVVPEHGAVTMRDLWVPGWMVGEHRKCWYRVWYWLSGMAVLRVEKWIQRRPPLFDFFLHEEYNRWLNERSRARSINGPQMYANDIRRLFVWATLYQVSPPAFGIGVGLPQTSQSYSPGTLYNLKNAMPGAQIVSLQQSMQLTPFPAMIELARQDAELASHLGMQAHGIRVGGSTTATEVNRTGLGQDVGIDEDVAYASFGLTEMAEYVCLDLLHDHYLDWYPWYADVLPRGIVRSDFDKMYYFKVNGEVASDTPEAVLAQTAQLTQAVASLMQMDPTLAMRYPDLAPGLLRAAVEAANRGNMDSLLPSPEEEETMRAQQEAMIGPFGSYQDSVGGGLQLPVLGLPPGLMGGGGGPYAYSN